MPFLSMLLLALASCSPDAGALSPAAMTPAAAAELEGLVGQAGARPQISNEREPQGSWLTLVEVTSTSAKVHVAPTGCPPIPPPTYGAMEVWIAPYQGIVKTDVGGGDWTLAPLAPGNFYRVFAWYEDTCGAQHTSNEISFTTPTEPAR